MKRLFQTLTILTALSLSFAMTAFAGSWNQDEKGWSYQKDDKTQAKSEWMWIDGNGDGVSECYYFDNRGYCQISTTTPDGCTVNDAGAWTVDGAVQTKGTGAEEAPASAAISQETNANQTAQEKTQMVWVSRTGSKYHSRENCSNMKDPSYMTLSEAQAMGRTPCKKCY